MKSRTVAFLGGNGHCAARLDAAREALAHHGVALADVPYPGFEGRPRALGLESFLDAVASAAPDAPLVYATGIGGLLALGLRARGEWRDRRLLLQAPVLWGLEHRWMPRLMRFAPARRLATRLFASRSFRARFGRRYFERPPSPAELGAFFSGYDRCAALPDLFAWVTPAWLRELERRLRGDGVALAHIEVWWGGRDRVVTVDELRWTERALGASWPLRVFPHWGHYPMIDAPDEWAPLVANALSVTTALR